MITQNEYNFLRMVHEAERIKDPITFMDDMQKIEEFRKMYGEVCESLIDKFYITGAIDKFCELNTTDTGLAALHEFKVDAEKAYKEKHNKRALIISFSVLIVAIISALISFLIQLKCC